MERLTYCGILLIAFVLFGLGITFVDNYVAKQLVQRDAELLSNKLAMYIDDSANELRNLPDITEDYQCTADNFQLLSDTVFNSTFIRWTAVLKDLTVLCASQKVDRHVESVVQHQIASDLTMAVVNHSESAPHELFLARQSGEYQYVASIVPMNPRYFVPVKCQNCLEYTITIDSVNDLLAPMPFIEFGFEEFEGNHAIEHVVTLRSERYLARFALTGNNDFLDQYRSLTYIMVVILSLILSSLVALYYRYWLSRYSSTRAQIKHAIKHGEFIPYYQPIVNVADGKVVGAEVLMRWLKGNGELIPPNQFIPYAESQGLIVDMTYSMLDVMVADFEKLAQQKTPLFFSINIVPEHLKSDRLFDYIKALQDSGKLKQYRISLEITERQPITDLVEARKMLDKFYAIGIDLKLDDAGMGYGGFSYVQKLGISTLKIDKAFIDTIGVKDIFNEKTLDAIISFSKKSGLSVIAEGVETDEQLNYLKEQNVELAQGYLFSKPIAAAAFFQINR
ncbi:EAL domain-containing protein [Shewanella olleyana]|uniref:EAL domain-containing protein n=1 Tax=Shewanella olleyana TaxID=135626 RepID=UPI002010A649|nr:EAL domain-containing protein [Shewanella olleyana]MCL1066735.1 EAL domain-containing protein [Shewanella olleyana]